MSQQTSYEIYAEKAQAGLIADLRPVEISSHIWEDVESSPFGLFVVRGTADGQALLPTASTDKVLGVCVNCKNYEMKRYEDVMKIQTKGSVSVMRRGNIYVKITTDCAAGDDVYLRYASGAGSTILGSVGNAAVVDETVIVSGWEFETSGLAGDIVKIRAK